MLIKVKDIIGEYCSQRHNGSLPERKGGEAIRELINQSWDKENKIRLDSFNCPKISYSRSDH